MLLPGEKTKCAGVPGKETDGEHSFGKREHQRAAQNYSVLVTRHAARTNPGF